MKEVLLPVELMLEQLLFTPALLHRFLQDLVLVVFEDNLSIQLLDQSVGLMAGVASFREVRVKILRLELLDGVQLFVHVLLGSLLFEEVFAFELHIIRLGVPIAFLQ